MEQDKLRGLLLTRKLLSQGFLLVKLKSLLRKFYGRHHDLVDRYGISASQMTTDMFHLSQTLFPILSSFMTYHRVCNQINTMGATSGAGIAYPSGAPQFTPGFQWGSCYSIFSFICMFCRSLFVLLCFVLLTIVLSVLRYTDSDYSFGILRIFLYKSYPRVLQSFHVILSFCRTVCDTDVILFICDCFYCSS